MPTDDELSGALVGIGFKLATTALPEPNIEDTLVFASIGAMDRGDLRVLDLLVTWFGVHHEWVNADRLIRLARAQSSARVRALWSALASWQAKDRRFARLVALHRGPRVDALATGTEYQIGRHGEDPRFAATKLRVPVNTLRGREADILTPAALARQHAAYRHRVVMGPSYRADAWAALTAAPSLSATELARRAYLSFATAWQVRRSFQLVAAAPALPGLRPAPLTRR